MAGRFCIPLLFVFVLTVAQNYTQIKENDLENDTVGEDEELETTSISTVSTPDPCHCFPISYGKDEMSGEIKSPGYPDSYCHNFNCTFEIEPHPDRIIKLFSESMNMEARYDVLHLYQSVVINSTKRLIFYRDLNVGSKGSNVAAKGVGFYLIMTTDDDTGGKFKLSFERILPENSNILCPYPLLYATKEPQSIKDHLWPIGGCSFHIFSVTPILVQSKCTTYGHTWNVRTYHPGTQNKILDEEIGIYSSMKEEIDSSDIRIFPVSSWSLYSKPMNFCKFEFQMTHGDACECPKDQALATGESLNISSPGYPYLTCLTIECFITIEGPEVPSGFKPGFTIFAFHSPKSSDDSLQIEVNPSSTTDPVVSLANYDDKHTMDEPLTVIGKELKISYTASAAFEKDHGFMMTVKAVSIPSDCLCPSNYAKLLLTEGSFSFRIPPHCEVMTCRYVIISPEYRRLFRLQISYNFPNEDESLIIRSNEITHRYESLGSVSVRRRLNMLTDSKISILYSRVVENGTAATTTSSVNMTWVWLGSFDCACHDGLQKAEAEWLDIYSPRYPNDDYCINTKCVYILEAPEGHHVEMNVTFFETEPHSDYVTLFDGNDTTKRHLLQLNGHVLMAPMVRSTGRNATIVFTSDHSITAKGFAIAFRAVPNDDFNGISPLSSGAISMIFNIFLVILIVVAIGYIIIIKGKNHSFRNPLYIPNIRYSVSGEREIYVEQN